MNHVYNDSGLHFSTDNSTYWVYSLHPEQFAVVLHYSDGHEICISGIAWSLWKGRHALAQLAARGGRAVVDVGERQAMAELRKVGL